MTDEEFSGVRPAPSLQNWRPALASTRPSPFASERLAPIIPMHRSTARSPFVADDVAPAGAAGRGVQPSPFTTPPAKRGK